MYRLVIVDDEGKTTVVPLFDDVITIGRKGGSTVILPERNISRLHAKLTRAEGHLRIEDLSSYTGVIVNGKRIHTRAILNPGDRLAMGDYRMVLEREPDLDEPSLPQGHSRTTVPDTPTSGVLPEAFQVAPDIKSHSKRPRKPVGKSRAETLPVSRLPLVVAGGIIGTAVMFGGLMVYNAYRARQRVPAPDTQGIALIESGQAFWEALKDCQFALRSQDYPRATLLGQKALALRPDSEQAQSCMNSASRAHKEQQAFEQGKTMFEEGRIEDAYQHFKDTLAENSAFRSRDEVIQSARQYAALRLSQAQAQARTLPELALRRADEILAMSFVPAHVRNDAQALHDRLSNQSARRAALSVQAIAHKSADPLPKKSPTTVKETEAVPLQAPWPKAPNPPQANGLSAARECLQRGDNACALLALRRAGSSAELALRIATHRQMGNTQAAIRDMQTYIRRYPSEPRAMEYQEFMSLREETPSSGQ